ncbi:PDR/VanB family oxidoreductase [Mycobacterium sp. CVI_P3]|uniref:PDR/VanB family oxidoreductase n=1 Tax=Mycobacterium pinniadriaticum TaxID=2994102 RepID=A0ABT3SKW5_9MYCO|nr:PDR/VanB family oxidoreductase [Mycobacterium pinniadriaticum]MCX2933734.1 PDR/VanB family oxidoreductase [Mycobacterium pinniadriaticum]MCX2940156.1 PDR/VanB family oxidoreductase [Mycobacterium pinniadriaticum]
MSAAATSPEYDLTLTLARKEVVADGVVRLALRDAGGASLPSWKPGAHIDLVLDNDLVRQYSLCGDLTDTAQFEVCVLREETGRGGSKHVHDQLSEGSTVRIKGPRNNFHLVEAQEYVFIAGGIGITPIVPMIRSVAARGAEWRLIYGGRTRKTMAFAEQLAAENPDRVDIRPQDETGLLDIAGVVDELVDVTDVRVYCCGPEPLLAVVEEACASRGISLHVERFAPKAGALDGSCEEFVVELARSGVSLTVPADCSIIEVLEEAGVMVPFSCEEGICGTCQTTVLAGVPDHHDSVLTEEEQAAGDTMTVCVSRSRTPRLVLDL